MRFAASLLAGAIALAVSATSAQAAGTSHYFDFEDDGFPTGASFLGDTSTFVGVLDFATTVTVENAILNRAPVIGDAIIGADVLVTAHFIDGELDTTEDNTFEVSKGTDIFYKAEIKFGRILPDPFIGDKFQALLRTGNDNPTVNVLGSEWVDYLFDSLTGSGGNAVFSALYDEQTGDVWNIEGKFIPSPEPGTLALVVLGLGAVALRRRRQKQQPVA